MNFVLKIVHIFDNNEAYSTFVFQLLILCSSEVTLDVFRQKVATSYEVTSVVQRDRIQFNITPTSLYKLCTLC